MTRVRSDLRKHIKKSDILFIIAFLLASILYFLSFHYDLIWVDEAFYPSIALRLINGDSLVSDEWHLSQFSSLFLYLPVKFWLTVKGSTEGFIFYSRCLYLCIHATGASGIYLFFRKHGIWAVAASLLFFTQCPLSIMCLNYNSLFLLFLTASCLLLLAIHKNPKPFYYILTGILYACTCVCNPFFCGIFFAYAFGWLLIWFKNSQYHKKNILLSNKERQKRNKKLRKIPHAKREDKIFFGKKEFLLFLFGICITAIICLVFFFGTSGSMSAFSQNFKQLLTDTEHDVFSSPLQSLWSKLKESGSYFSLISMKMFFLLPLFFIALLVDKKRLQNNHRIVYLLLAFALAIFYIVGIFRAAFTIKNVTLFWSLPFFIFSTTCYILTQNKRKNVFFCIWVPGITGAMAQYLASNLHFTAISWVLTISNLAGVFFAHDFFSEISADTSIHKSIKTINKTALIFCLCLQILFYSISAFTYPLLIDKEKKQITDGPLAEIYISKRYYGTTSLSMQDLDHIQDISNKDDPVLILSNMCWLYLYIDRPFATYSAWMNSFEPDRLREYYRLNPENIPKYIYISAVDIRNDYGVSFKMAQDKADVMKEMFKCSQEKLSRGLLLTVIE